MELSQHQKDEIGHQINRMCRALQDAGIPKWLICYELMSFGFSQFFDRPQAYGRVVMRDFINAGDDHYPADVKNVTRVLL